MKHSAICLLTVVFAASAGSGCVTHAGLLAKIHAEMNQEPVAKMQAHLQSIQACFAGASKAALPQSNSIEVVPQAGSGFVMGAVVSPRGDTFATIGSDVVLYSTRGLQLGAVPAGELGIEVATARAFYSADGGQLLVVEQKMMADAADSGVVIDARSAKVTHRCKVNPPGSGQALGSVGGRTGFVTGPAPLLVDGATGNTTPLAVPGEDWQLFAGDFSADGSRLLAMMFKGEEHALNLFDVATGKVLSSLKVENDDALEFAVSNDGRVWGSASGLKIKVYGAGGAVQTIEQSSIGSVVFSADGQKLFLTHGKDWSDTVPAWLDLTTKKVERLASASYAGFHTHENHLIFSGSGSASGYVIDRERFDFSKMATATPEMFTSDKTGTEYRVEMSKEAPGKNYRFPELVAKARDGAELWRTTVPSSHAMGMLDNADVVALTGNGLSELSAEDRERFREGLSLSVEPAALAELVIAPYVHLFDSKTGAAKASLRSHGVAAWQGERLLMATIVDGQPCARFYSTKTWAYDGDPVCNAPQAGASASPDPYLRFTLVKHPAKQQAALLGSDGSAYLFDGNDVRQLVPSRGHTHDQRQGTFSAKSNVIFVGGTAGVQAIDLTTKAVRDIAKLNAYSLALAGNESRLVIGADKSIQIFDVASGKRLARWYLFGEEWVLLGEDGVFAASPKGARHLAIRVNGEVQALQQYAEQLYRPDVVFARLQGGPAPEIKNVSLQALAQQGKPPVVHWVSPGPGASAQRDVTLKVRLEVRSGGLSRVEWRLNGTVVGTMDQQRGLEIQREALEVSKLVTLAPGANRIEVVAYTKSGDVASAPAVADFQVKDAVSDAPSLYVLAVGINAYRDRTLQLKYAVPDAQALSTSIKAAAGRVFRAVDVTTLTDAQVTREGLRGAFSSLARKAKSNDVFIFYLAGHGITLDGRYHFLPVDFRYHNEDSVKKDGVTQDNLRDWLAEIPSLKSLVLLDTCNSGSFVKAQMATRGIAEKTAIDKLTRATGRGTIAASTDTQVAIEGHEGHGVFTWAVLRALTSSDKDGDGLLSTTELAAYVQNAVPELTYKRWGYEQVPQVVLVGREFPVGVTQ